MSPLKMKGCNSSMSLPVKFANAKGVGLLKMSKGTSTMSKSQGHSTSSVRLWPEVQSPSALHRDLVSQILSSAQSGPTTVIVAQQVLFVVISLTLAIIFFEHLLMLQNCWNGPHCFRECQGRILASIYKVRLPIIHW